MLETMSETPENQPQDAGKSPSDTTDEHERDDREASQSDPIALPSHVAGSGTLDRLVFTARD